MMRVYVGELPFGDNVWIEQDGARIRRLPARLDLENHSPTGFAWGYGGSGPAQLALALLADALGDDAEALRLHQYFKWRVTSQLPQREGWCLSHDFIWRVAGEIDRDRRSIEPGAR